jgi:hypothetical protein
MRSFRALRVKGSRQGVPGDGQEFDDFAAEYPRPGSLALAVWSVKPPQQVVLR